VPDGFRQRIRHGEQRAAVHADLPGKSPVKLAVAEQGSAACQNLLARSLRRSLAAQ